MKNISVIGAGAMGNGIAHVFAQRDFQVTLIARSQNSLDIALSTISINLDRMIRKGIINNEDKRKTLSNINTAMSINDNICNADLVIETAPENIEVKFKIFQELDARCKPSAILASNTSSLSITKIASVTKRADKVIGMHFMNPVPVMKLVEVIRGYSTSDETVQAILHLLKGLDKVAVESNNYPGFISNRIIMPMINEAIYSLFEGVAGVQEIDTVMKLGMAHPMGPLQLADFLGLDVCLAILNILFEGFGTPKYAPCPLLVNIVTSGNLGVKSGKGFYDYSSTSKELVVSKEFRNKNHKY